jgi:hypothetical protein
MSPSPKRDSIVLIAGLLLVNALALFPLLTSGYSSDDIFNSQIRGHMIQMDRSLWGVTSFYAMQWLKNEGRLFPLAFYVYSVFYLLGDVLLYKFFVLGVILASIAAFFVFLRRLTRSELIPGIAVLLLPLLFQFRASWDPILAFCAAYPLLSLLLLCSLNLFLRAVDEGDRLPPLGSVLLFLCGGLLFEVTYPMFLVYGGVAYLRLKNVKAAARASWPFLAVTLCLTLASITLRTQATAPSGTYQMHLDVVLIIRTYFVQLFGAVPFSYFFFDPHAAFANRIGKWPATLVQVLPLVVLLAALTVLALRRRLSNAVGRQNTTQRAGVLVIGVLLFTIPASVISLSSKFQAQTWGDAYLPVYVTYFGLSVLLAVGLSEVYSLVDRRGGLLGRRLIMAALGVWVLLFAFNLRNNWLVVQAGNEAVWDPRVLAERALAHGLLNGIGPNSVLLVSGVDPWDNPDEYSQHTGLKLAVYGLNETRDLTPVFQGLGAACNLLFEETVCDLPPGAPVYTLAIRHLTGGTGAVLLAHVRRSVQRGGVVRGLFSEGQVLAYFQMPSSGQPLTAAVAGRNMPNTTESGGGGLFRVADGGGLQVVKEGNGWKLVSLRREGAFDALSLRGEISAERTGSSVLMAKDRQSFELHAAGPELLHVGYESRDIGNGVEYPPLSLGSDVSIEVLVTPGELQVPYADILSNHAADSTGFCIEQMGPQTNKYSLAFGSGKSWMEVGTFALSPGHRYYISLQMKNTEARLYVNGALVASKVLPAAPLESPHPVRIGNWVAGGRRFNGWVEEVLIARGAKSEAMIFQDSKRLLTTLAPGDAVKSLLSKGDGPSLVHEGFDSEGSKSHSLSTGFVLPESFTLELLVRPDRFQVAYATIISNHPGEKNFQGFTIEEPVGKTNWYAFSMGNGRTWALSREFFLSPEKLHYLVVTKQRGQAAVYVDGKLLEVLEGDLAVSAYPVTVGNWIGKSRPFNGAIQELRIVRSVATARSVAEQAAKLRTASAQ